MRIIVNIKARIMPIILVVALVFSFVIVPTKKAEAIAPVVAGGAAAAAALAAELGISVEALAAATVAVVGVGTGVAINQAATERGWRNLWLPGGDGTSTSDWWGEYGDGSMNLPGVKPWDDLSDEEKAGWDSPKQYTQSQWLAMWLEMGLITEDGNGGFEPTPEPNDPNEKKRWQKGRNILTLVGVGAITVGAQEASNWLADTVGQGLRGLLYGDNTEQSFDLVYDSITNVNGVNVPVRVMSVEGYDWQTDVNLTPLWVAMTVRNDITSGTRAGMSQAMFITDGVVPNQTVATPNIQFGLNGYNGVDYYNFNTNSISQVTLSNANNVASNLKKWELTGSGDVRIQVPRQNPTGTYFTAINGLYPGTYYFDNGVTFSGGSFHGQTNLVSENYGQMTNTPLGLGQAINQGGSGYSGFMGNVGNAGNGNANVVTIPSGYTNAQDVNQLINGLNDYLNYIRQVPENQVVPVPDDAPVVNPNPNPNPNPSPDIGFTDGFTEEVSRLLRQPFDQLFPFCLIGDLERLVDMIKDVGTQGDSSYNGTASFVLPLSDFGIDGADDLEFDLAIISHLAVYVRPFLTALFITGLLVGTFAFFLKRGGE